MQVPWNWLKQNGIATNQENLDTLAATLEENGANGIPVWQSYCLGLNPNEADSVVLCVPAQDQPDEAGTFKFTTNVAIPEGLTGVAVTASLDRKSGGDWVRQGEPIVVEHGTPVAFTASADPENALSFFA